MDIHDMFFLFSHPKMGQIDTKRAIPTYLHIDGQFMASLCEIALSTPLEPQNGWLYLSQKLDHFQVRCYLQTVTKGGQQSSNRAFLGLELVSPSARD